VAKVTAAKKAASKKSVAKESSSRTTRSKVCHALFIVLRKLSIVADNKETAMTCSKMIGSLLFILDLLLHLFTLA